MKKILLSIFMIIVTAGCFDKTPTCSDEIVTNEVIKLYRDYSIKEITNKEADIKFAELMLGGDKEEINKEFANMINEIKTMKMTIEHIRTISIDKSVNKHSCLGTLKYQLEGESNSEEISYSFQPTDDKKNIWIQIDDIK